MNSDIDLFGEEVKTMHCGGYAAMPGTGPSGKTCKDCKYYYIHRTGSRKTYRKCNLINWTHGSATDIKASSPSCHRFED